MRWVLPRLGGLFNEWWKRWAGFLALGVLSADDAPGNSGGIVADQMTLQVTVGVPVA